MSYHILHLLSHNLRVRVKLDQFHIAESRKRDQNIRAVVGCRCHRRCRARPHSHASALRRMAELNVLMLICNEKFEPCALTLPYYRPTNTELLRRQIEWTPEWKTANVAANHHRQSPQPSRQSRALETSAHGLGRNREAM